MEPFGAALRPIYMDTSHVVVSPAPQFEHPGRWAGRCECADAQARTRPEPPVRALHVVPEPPPAPDAAAIAAREFAIAAMTVVLEVMDRRRPVSAMAPFVADPVADHVISRGRARHDFRTGSGNRAGLRLRRVHIQITDSGAAEFFGSYTCAERVRAFAGRMATVAKPSKAPRRPPWQIQGLMLD